MRSTGEAMPTGRPLRTLLLEDNRVDARLTQEGLRDCDDRIDCDIASSLREVSAQRLATVDCAVIDLSLPDASGLQALDRILDIAPDIPIVVLTGFDDGATERGGTAARRAGLHAEAACGRRRDRSGDPIRDRTQASGQE